MGSVAGSPETKRGQRAGRRANHDGTVYFDQTLQRWRGEIQLEGRRRKVSAKTQWEVQRKLGALRQEYLTNTLPDPHKLTVGAYVTDWLENVVKKYRRLSTYSQYESPIRVHVLPRLGSKRLRDLHPRDLERLYADLGAGVDAGAYKRPGRALGKRGLAPKSIRNLHSGLHAAFARAVRHKLLASNPADNVELPALPRRQKLAVTPEDVQQLLAHTAAEGDQGYALWCFLANTGLRIGEALALRWESVDLEEGWFTVEENLDRLGQSGQTKTEAGVREVPLTDAALAALRDHRARQEVEKRELGEGYADGGLVFPTTTGKPNNERNALRSLKRAAKRAGVPTAIALHDFRRMAASLLVAGGVDIVTAAGILGHKRASVLLDVYARALRAPKRAAAERLQAILYPAETAPPLPQVAELPH